ncbi:MAG: hypothetical protein A2527_08270 [Candidatus Lambdaproteobacteria bacterium RIFOXYD2_FULL_50_16]|uniref:alanine dehydrogenase n=1 Tax=Candidatus Lambdaproteobacteria bacterium RIFOXYD2_FULL_50_16 TaxID=1817772 RepID=A0A1F6GAM2_9PROT|nr:MAG: hypothetical protein A2527_08270 [Candidatus Lambdaproteobacteria bacterium RIFOXYD2_FULL_50_16]
MKIGIPKEIKTAERRVALTPKACEALVQAGAEVYLETLAGDEAGFADWAYQAVGVGLVKDATALYQEAQLVVKVKEPQPSEWADLRPDQQLFCYLHLGGDPKLCQALKNIGLKAYGFETVGQGGETPLLAPMSAIAGRLSVQLGARFLHRVKGGRGTLLGGVNGHPAGQVCVLGGGVAGREAATIALGQGAKVTLLDLNADRLSQLKKELPNLQVALNQGNILEELLPNTDLLIGAVYLKGKKAPLVVSKALLGLLPKGAVAVDIAIDQGGCFWNPRPCTHEDPFYIERGILRSAITNLPAAVPQTASEMLSAAILPYVKALALGWELPGLKEGLNLEAGNLKIEL